MPRGEKLTEEQVRYITARTREDATTKVISAELGVSERTVQRIRRPLLPPNNKRAEWPVGTFTKVRLMLEDGMSHREIIDTLHVSSKTLRKYYPDTAWPPEIAGAHRKTKIKKDGHYVVVL